MARVLVIDDDAAVRSVLKQILTAAGHEVMIATDGRTGLEAFQQNRPDAVITDIIMPNKEGIETIKSLRTIDPKVPIVAISGGGRSANLDFLPVALKYGANRALAKPFTRTDLLEALKGALSGTAAQAEPRKDAPGG